MKNEMILPFSLPYLCSNVRFKILDLEFEAEFFSIARTTRNCNEFRTSSKALFNPIFTLAF